MPSQKRNEGTKEYYNEKRQTSHKRRVSHLWYQNVQNRKELIFKSYFHRQAAPSAACPRYKPAASRDQQGSLLYFTISPKTDVQLCAGRLLI
jgi:hypothetical protein